jgi:6-O-methylguanine DNA methyltransferase, DNA binding domain/Metal binding domain of Ada
MLKEPETLESLAERFPFEATERGLVRALGANPVPIIVPCHRVIRGNGPWGHCAFGGELRTRLLAFEHATPALVGCATTRVVCRRGCPHERRIRDDRRVVFASASDAESMGYRPCRAGRPRPSGARARRASP